MFRRFAAALLFFSLCAHAGLPDGVELLHYERLVPVERLSGTPSAQNRLDFHAYGRTWQLDLAPHRTTGIDGLRLYRGEVAGLPGSWVRLADYRGTLSGMYSDGTELYVVESAESLGLGAAPGPVVFRLADLLVPPGLFACATHSHDGSAAEVIDAASAFAGLRTELAAAVANAPGATQRIEAGIVGDFEWFGDFGNDQGAAEAALTTRMNTVDGIFSQQLGVEIGIAELTVFNTASDPFTSTLDAEELLDEVANYKNAAGNRRALGLLHLFTGRNLADTTVGIAFRGAVCGQRFSTGLTERQPGNAFIDSLIAAHEIGHNFGAIHDGDSSPAGQNPPGIGAIDCTGTPDNVFLMAPSINGSTDFSQCSIDTMQDYLALPSSNCLTPIGAPDGSVGVPAATVVAGQDIPRNVTLTVDNAGGSSLNTVSVTITPEPELELLSITPANCAIVANTASCSFAAVAGRASIPLTLQLRGATIGTFSVDTALTASNDDDNTNNLDSFDVRVDPSVELAASVAGPASFPEGGSASYTATVTNNTPAVPATGVVLNITVPPGFTAANVVPSSGSCSVQGASRICALGTVGANASVSFDLSAAAIASNRILAATVSADQLDRDTSNDTGQLTVSATGTGGGGGGGNTNSGSGAPGLTLIALLLLAVARRHRKD